MPPTLQTTVDDPMNEPVDQARLAEIARLHGRSAFLAAYRVLGDASQAEDVQQDVFVRLLQTPQAAIESWPAWLATAATRLAIDRLRGRARWQRLLPMLARDTAPEVDRPEAEATRDERASWLRAALSRLPRGQAQCFALRHLNGLDNAAIAVALGMQPNHVGVNLHRASQRLRAQFAHDHNESENS